MAQTYSHLLKPITVQGVVLKNRIYGVKGLPHFLQGPESFPSETVIRYYAGLAKNGAAVVTVKGMAQPRDRTKMHGDSAHMTTWDINDPAVHNYFAHIANLIHYYGSKAFINIQRQQPDGVNISEVTPEDFRRLKTDMKTAIGREITKEEIKEMIQGIVDTCRQYQLLGFDGVNLYGSYQASIIANSFSPRINKRTDEYGGSVAGRSRLILELCAAIKEACGKNFLVELQFSGEEGPEDGYTIEDTIELLRLGEGLIDIVQLRAINGNLAHPTGLNSELEAPITLAYAEAIKKAGVNVITAPTGGFQDPELINKWIGEGKMDMAAICRGLFCDFDYYEKILDGRGEDVVPCIRCNNCHGINFNGPWYSFCSVNPKLGLQDRLDLVAPPAKSVRRVAVIGGGPAGMVAALTARQRGHEVTLYEKETILGGQLIHADYASFKWPLKRYKDYLIAQMDKQGVTVKLGCSVTPEEIRAANYDAVIAATGAVPKLPNIPGADAAEIWKPIEVFGKENQLGKRVVVVGGSETGVETALYLADHGHDVTVLTRQRELATDANQIHYVGALRDYYNAHENFHAAVNAHTTQVSPDRVTFTVKKPEMAPAMPGMPDMPAGMPGMPPMGAADFGAPGPYDADGIYTVECDSVVVCGGVEACQEAALNFSGCARQFFMIGDCSEPGRVFQAVRSAFAAASQI